MGLNKTAQRDMVRDVDQVARGLLMMHGVSAPPGKVVRDLPGELQRQCWNTAATVYINNIAQTGDDVRVARARLRHNPVDEESTIGY